MATILWVENKRANSPSFIPGLREKGYKVKTVSTGKQAIEALDDLNPDIVIINTLYMRSNGSRICSNIRSREDSPPILLIADQGNDYSSDIQADIILTMPFTIRKLNNRILRVLPGEGGHVIRCGPIRMDIERKRVRCLDKESKLTPRLVLLLKTLMDHPGEVVERKQLFKEIWETDYIGDTRTLDVHISWLREAIEKDPKNPRYLKTIRGVGYRLDV